MADDEGYVEVEAVVRMPKGERLADSRKTEGWSRGFTPKSSDKGPEHVEIRLKAQSTSRASDTGPAEPEVTYDYEYTDPPREKTREEEEAEELLRALVLLGVIKAAEWAQPHIRRLVTERLIPYLSAKRGQWRERMIQRKADKQGAGAAAMPALTIVPAEESQAVGTALAAYEGNMTSDEARQHLIELLLAQHFVNEKRRLLADARITDGTMPLEIASAVEALTSKEVAKALESILATQPTVLDDIRTLLEVGPRGRNLHLEHDAMRVALRLTDRN